MYYQYELTHFKGDMGHGVASDALAALDREGGHRRRIPVHDGAMGDREGG